MSCSSARTGHEPPPSILTNSCSRLLQIKKIDKSKFPELRARADGNLNNLVAFVQYRKDILKARK